MAIQVHFLSASIKKYRSVNEGNMREPKFGIDDMTPATMVKHLLTVCDEPTQVWSEINKQMPGFFTPVIKQEFGIADDFSK